MENIQIKLPDNSPAVQTESPKNAVWSIRDIALGISLLITYELIILFVLDSNSLRYRPWISTHFTFALEIVLFSSLFGYSYHICKKRNFWPLSSAIHFSKVVKEAFRGLLYVLLLCLVIGSAEKLIEFSFKATRSANPLIQWLKNDPNTYLTVSILIMSITIGPIAEEFFFRGFLFNAFKSRLPLWLATCGQAILFSALHNADIRESFTIFLTGIGLAVIYERRKDLLSPIMAHIFINSVWAIPLLILTIQNYHSPASNWSEAQTKPSWIPNTYVTNIERKDNGLEQVQYAINTWGSKGSKQWKREAIAFDAVLQYFPEDRLACAKACSGMVSIYARYLRDYRRAIVEADIILSQYPDQKEQCSHALLDKAFSYMMLKDFENAGKAYREVINEYQEYEDTYKAAQDGNKWVNYLVR